MNAITLGNQLKHQPSKLLCCNCNSLLRVDGAGHARPGRRHMVAAEQVPRLDRPGAGAPLVLQEVGAPALPRATHNTHICSPETGLSVPGGGGA